MNKIEVLLCLILSFFLVAVAGNKIRKSQIHTKEILTVNNLNEVYSTNIQQEMLATSDFKCVFRCTSTISEQLIHRKYNEVINDFNDKSFNIVKSIDMKYYCSSAKPLYVVKLTPDVKTKEDAVKLCNRSSKIYKFADEYCKRESECNSPTFEIQNI